MDENTRCLVAAILTAAHFSRVERKPVLAEKPETFNAFKEAYAALEGFPTGATQRPGSCDTDSDDAGSGD